MTAGMRPFLVGAVILVSGGAGAVVSLTSGTGLYYVASFVYAAVLLVLYRSRSLGLSGAVGVVISGVSLVLLLGTLPRTSPVYGTNPGLEVLTIYAAGASALVLGAWFAGITLGGGGGMTRTKHSLNPVSGRNQGRLGMPIFSIRAARFSSRSATAFRSVALIAVLVAFLNYATGEIPVLSSDVNNARLNSVDYGIMGRFWPLVIPVLQLAIVVAYVNRSNGPGIRGLGALGILSFAALALNGSRSLLLVPIVILLLIWIERRRPSLLGVFLSTAALGVAVGVIGFLRERSSVTGGSVFDSLDRAVQTGPRVFSLLLQTESQPAVPFLLGDLFNFWAPSIDRSDRMVTIAIGRDPGAIGGSPPTIWGGFYYDFGAAGVLIGGVLVGFILGLSRVIMVRRGDAWSLIWFGYLASYILLSSYSYVSFRPSWITVLAVILLCARLGGPSHANSHGFEVRVYSRRGRDSYRNSQRRTA